MAALQCCITEGINAASGCISSFQPGVIRAWLINKADLQATATTVDECGNVNSISLCSYPPKCIMDFRLERQSMEAFDEWVRNGQTWSAAPAIEGTLKLKDCNDHRKVRALAGPEMVVIRLDKSGIYEIAGHLANGEGFFLESFSRATGKAPGDTPTATIRLQKDGTPDDTWYPFLLGTTGDSQAARVVLTQQWLDDNNCDAQEEDSCGCSGE